MFKKIGIFALSATLISGGILPSISHAQNNQDVSKIQVSYASDSIQNTGQSVETIYLNKKQISEIEKAIAEQKNAPQPRGAVLGAYIATISIAGIGTVAIYAGGVIVAGVVAYAGWTLYNKVAAYVEPYIIGASIPKHLRKDGNTVDLGKFKDKYGNTPLKKSSGTFKNGEWVIEKDTAGHGGRKWKIKKGTKRIGSLDGSGNILSK